ncbi:MAG: CBS domain-containing protein [Acidobacteriia bacterium]|nr:CBS domain-containing protein [Terriglobia bacterium]
MIKIAQVPPPAVSMTATVKEAVPIMGSEQGCALAVMDGDRLAGTLSKDDLIKRVVAEGLDPDTTKVGEVMRSPAETISVDMEAAEALKLMFSHRRCFYPVVDQQGILKGWLALCHLFQNHVEDLGRELDALEAYLSADGPGG